MTIGKAGSVPEAGHDTTAGLWNFGELKSDDTRYHITLVVLGTVTKLTAKMGFGFHLSAFPLGPGGYVSDWSEAGALSRVCYEPTLPKTGLFWRKASRFHLRPSIILAMPRLDAMEVEVWAHLLTLFPECAEPNTRLRRCEQPSWMT